MDAKNTLLPVQSLLQSRGKLLEISKPVVMGILNATPDSFYNQGRKSQLDELLGEAEKMLEAGATLLDIGGISTRPDAATVTCEEELQRVLPVIQAIHTRFPDVWLSVDTYHASMAVAAVAEGASIINDISGGRFDVEMLATVARLKVPFIAMHIQGTPSTMQLNPQYDDVVLEVRRQLREICGQCTSAGIVDVVVDPGFGFGKTTTHNFQLLKNLASLRLLGRPILAGISRKSMIWKTLNATPDTALNGSTALHMVALQQGATILRVHDVKEAVEVIKLWEALETAL